MHNVHAIAVIALGILNEEEITLFILEVDIIGIISGNAFFTDKHCTLIPMRTVLGGIVPMLSLLLVILADMVILTKLVLVRAKN